VIFGALRPTILTDAASLLGDVPADVPVDTPISSAFKPRAAQRTRAASRPSWMSAEHLGLARIRQRLYAAVWGQVRQLGVSSTPSRPTRYP